MNRKRQDIITKLQNLLCPVLQRYPQDRKALFDAFYPILSKLFSPHQINQFQQGLSALKDGMIVETYRKFLLDFGKYLKRTFKNCTSPEQIQYHHLQAYLLHFNGKSDDKEIGYLMLFIYLTVIFLTDRYGLNLHPERLLKPASKYCAKHPIEPVTVDELFLYFEEFAKRDGVPIWQRNLCKKALAWFLCTGCERSHLVQLRYQDIFQQSDGSPVYFARLHSEPLWKNPDGYYFVPIVEPSLVQDDLDNPKEPEQRVIAMEDGEAITEDDLQPLVDFGIFFGTFTTDLYRRFFFLKALSFYEDADDDLLHRIDRVAQLLPGCNYGLDCFYQYVPDAESIMEQKIKQLEAL